MVRAAAPKSTVARLTTVKGGERKRLEQAQLLGAAPGRTEMVGRPPRSRLIEAALLAGEFETAADHPGHRPAAGHALAPARIVVLAAAGLADELEDVAVAVGKIGHQPFAEEVAHFERKPKQHVAGLPHADGGCGIEDALDLGVVKRGD